MTYELKFNGKLISIEYSIHWLESEQTYEVEVEEVQIPLGQSAFVDVSDIFLSSDLGVWDGTRHLPFGRWAELMIEENEPLARLFREQGL
jgi:hypothetical protein